MCDVRTQSVMTDSRRPTHPGEFLREDVVPALPVSTAEFARRLGVSRQTVYDLMSEKNPVTVNIALRLERLLGPSAEMWLGMQQAHDLHKARHALADELAAMTPLAPSGWPEPDDPTSGR